MQNSLRTISGKSVESMRYYLLRGNNRAKYKNASIKKLLMGINKKPKAEQRKIIGNKFDNWRVLFDRVEEIVILKL